MSDNDENDENYNPDSDVENTSTSAGKKKRKIVQVELSQIKEKRLRSMTRNQINRAKSLGEIAAMRRVMVDEIEKKYKEIKEMINHEFICPVCHNTARDGCSFMMIDKCKHVVCAVCQCQILTKAMRDYTSSKCPECRGAFKDVTLLDFECGPSKKITEFDVKQKINEIVLSKGQQESQTLTIDSDDDSDSDSDQD